MRNRDRDFVPAKKLVCERYKTPDGVICETYTHSNGFGDARRRAKAMNLLHPGCNAEAFLTSANPSRFEDRRGRR